MAFICLILLISLLTPSFSLITKCSNGPIEWCHDIQLAKECKAISLCRNIWSNTYPPNNISDECSFCQLLLKDLSKINNFDDKHSLITDSCALSSDSQILQKCQTMHSELELITDIYNNDIDFFWICDSLKFCAVPSQIYNQISTDISKDENLCELCKRGVNNLEGLLQNSTFEYDLSEYLEKFCANFSSTEKIMCKEGVKRMLPDMLKKVINMVETSNICVKTEICTAEMMRYTFPDNTNLCNDCKKIVDQARHFFDKSEAHIMDGARHICQSFPTTIQEKCSSFIRNYIPAIYENINMFLNPVQMCQAFKICPATFFDQELSFSRDDSQDINNDDEFVIENGDYKNKWIEFVTSKGDNGDIPKNMESGPLDWPSNKAECEMCNIVVNELLTLLGDNRTRENIVHNLDKVCSIIPKKYRMKCDDFIEEYADSILILTQNNLTPREICQMFHFCQKPSTSTNPDVDVNHHENTATHKREEGPKIRSYEWPPDKKKCEMCDVIVKQLLDLIGDNRTIQGIQAGLDEVCSKLPELDTKCQDFVQEYSQPLFVLTQNNLNASQICQLFDFCKNGSFSRIPNLKEALFLQNSVKEMSMDYCPVCHIAVAWIGQQIGKNATDQQLLDFARKFCHDLPHQFSQTCLQYVKDYGIDALRIISEYMDPDIVCQKFGLCPSIFNKHSYIA